MLKSTLEELYLLRPEFGRERQVLPLSRAAFVWGVSDAPVYDKLFATRHNLT